MYVHKSISEGEKKNYLFFIETKTTNSLDVVCN